MGLSPYGARRRRSALCRMLLKEHPMPPLLPPSLRTSRRPLLRTVVLYEDFESAARALKICDLIQNRVGDDTPLRLSVWRMRDLKDSGTRDLAASAAAVSYLVILSASWHQEEAPEALRQWLGLWLSLNGDSEHSLLALVPAHSTRRLNNWSGWPRTEISRHPVSFSVHPVESGIAESSPLLEDARNTVTDETLWRPGTSRPTVLFPSEVHVDSSLE